MFKYYSNIQKTTEVLTIEADHLPTTVYTINPYDPVIRISNKDATAS